MTIMQMRTLFEESSEMKRAPRVYKIKIRITYRFELWEQDAS